MFTLLHISDIHRSNTDPVSNDELISSILRDFDRASRESPSISYPDAIVVSGDLVKGAPLGIRDHEAILSRQYEEAFNLIHRLAEEFTNGDHSRIVIVPGNHDVDWNVAISSMTVVDKYDDEIPALLNLPNSPYRWSWKVQKLYRIVYSPIYENRFLPYRRHVQNFYQGSLPSGAFDVTRGWNIHSFLNNSIAIVGFNSCVNNDCYRGIGEIPSQIIAQSHLALRRIPSLKLAIAVWHHSLQGSPYLSDYMDSSIIPLLIDAGFGLALHGHQHKPSATPYNAYISDNQTMIVVSGGTICGAHKELPVGQNRSFNIIQINELFHDGLLHTRGMVSPGVFGPARQIVWGGLSFTKIQWNATPIPTQQPSANEKGYNLGQIEEVENCIRLHQFDRAVLLIDENNLARHDYGNKLLTEAVYHKEDWGRLIAQLKTITNDDELAKKAIALMKLKQWTECAELLQYASQEKTFSPLLIKELSMKLQAEKGAKHE